jgi:hypothetical protein
VEFQDGTSEQNIEQWMKDIKGRRRASDAGWYSVEVTLPQPQTPDGFMEALRKAKIVKAVKTRVQTAAVP